jgi:hypothetical protein
LKFLFDNNLPPHLARALNELCTGYYGSKHSIIHLKDKFAQNAADHEWITTLSNEGNWSIISQDTFRKNDLERQAIKHSGLNIFVLSKQWSDHKFWDKSHNLIKWWPHMMDYIDRIQGGAAIRIPWRMSGRFEQIRM